MKNFFNKINIKHKIIIVGSIAIGLFVWFSKSDGFQNKEIINQHKEIKNLHHSKDSLYKVADNLIRDIQMKEKKYNSELDSLNRLIGAKELSDEDMDDLKSEIERVNWLLYQEKKKRERIETTSVEVRDSVIYNIKEVDSVVYNIKEVDSIVYNIEERDTVIYNEITVDTLIMRSLKFD